MYIHVHCNVFLAGPSLVNFGKGQPTALFNVLPVAVPGRNLPAINLWYWNVSCNPCFFMGKLREDHMKKMLNFQCQVGF